MRNFTDLTQMSVLEIEAAARAERGRMIAKAIAGFFAAVVDGWQERRTRAAAIAELEALSDLELRDIGINRTEIAAAVDGRIARPQFAAPRNDNIAAQPEHRRAA